MTSILYVCKQKYWWQVLHCLYECKTIHELFYFEYWSRYGHVVFWLDTLWRVYVTLELACRVWHYVNEVHVS